MKISTTIFLTALLAGIGFYYFTVEKPLASVDPKPIKILALADGDSVTAWLTVTTGGPFDVIPVSVTGDVQHRMAGGPGKQILWNAAADYPGQYWSQVRAKVIATDWGGPAVGGEMVYVPAGSFTMGSTQNPDEQPVHSVYLDAFYIDKYEVTNAEFKQFIDAGGYSFPGYWSPAGWAWRVQNGITQPMGWGAIHSGPAWPGFPVFGVSYYEAEAYANFVGKRLPTEAEWEKAARGNDARTYPWGEGIDGSRANYANSGDPYDDNTTPIGFYDGRLHPNPPFQTTNSPGPYGAYDQAGNLWEWVKDWYSSTYYSQSPPSNPQGPPTGSSRVVRGGGWGDTTAYLRCARRSGYGYGGDPSGRSLYLGFRCARTP